MDENSVISQLFFYKILTVYTFSSPMNVRCELSDFFCKYKVWSIFPLCYCCTTCNITLYSTELEWHPTCIHLPRVIFYLPFAADWQDNFWTGIKWMMSLWCVVCQIVSTWVKSHVHGNTRYLPQLTALVSHLTTETFVNTFSGSGLLPDGTKPLLKSMLTYCPHCLIIPG